jgi:cytochrome c oxidase subunit 2
MLRSLALITVVAVAALMLFAVRVEGQDATPPAASPGAGTAVASPMATPEGAGVDLVAAERGRNAAAVCLACHSVDGSAMVGPSWKGLWMSEVEFEDGTTTIVDAEYIRESVHEPLKRITKGYPPSMPPLGGVLTDEQLNDVIEYIKSLED